LESRVVSRFPLNDQEVLCRHLHMETANWVDDYLRGSVGAARS
jgi:glycine betaine catabolism A